MATEDIPKDVADFLAEHIDSVVQLEALLLLKTHADREWRSEEVARDLRIDPGWTEAALAQLATMGILQSTGAAYRYAPRTPRIDQTVVALAQAYENRRVSVISMIFSKPADPLRQFSDAFRFRKGEQGK